jgi:hypothetical protein
MHRPLDVDNRSAVELSNVPADGAAQLYAKRLTDPSLRKAVARSDVVLVGIGFNDTPWNRPDDPCNAAPRYAVVAWTKITPSCITSVTADFKQTLDGARAARLHAASRKRPQPERHHARLAGVETVPT